METDSLRYLCFLVSEIAIQQSPQPFTCPYYKGSAAILDEPAWVGFAREWHHLVAVFDGRQFLTRERS